MIKIGMYLLFFGIGSIILNYFGFEFKILMWLGGGYGGRLAFAGVGVLFILLGMASESEKQDHQS